MRRATVAAVAAAIVLAFSISAASAATDPSAVLDAWRAASGGDAWHGKVAMETAVKIAGQGMSGTGTIVTDLHNGTFVQHYTLGPASGAEGFDGKDVWQQGPNGDVNLEKGGDALPVAVSQAYQNANRWW